MKVTVSKEWLKSHLASRKLRVLDARTRKSYNKSHIKGAILADLFHYFIPGTDEKGLKRFHMDMASRLGKIGLTGKETIIVYESRLGMRAARVAWMLEYAGVRRVFLLEEGFQGWRRSHLPTEKTRIKPEERVFQINPVPSLLATADEIRSNRSSLLLDVRSKGEFTGTEGRECDRRRGRIPRARWLEWTSFIRKNGQRFKTRSEVAKDLDRLGLVRNRTVVTYCHRGARAASAFYALRSLGYSKVKNYVGSWHEWSARKGLPVERFAH